MTAGLEAILTQTTASRAAPHHVHVTIDRADGKVVRKDGFLNRMTQSLRRTVTYALKVDTWADIYDVEQTMRIFVTKEETKISFRLRVSAPYSRAEQIVQALADPVLGPSEVLFGVIRDAVRVLSDESQREGPDNLARRIARDRTNWQRRIQQSILDRIGLDSELIFELGPQVVDLPEVAVRHLDVRTKDAPHRTVSASVHVVLEPTEERAHDPLPNSDREREERVRMVVATAFRDEVMLYDFWFDRPKVERIVSQAVDRAFRATAHRTRRVQMEPVEAPMPLEEKVACNVAWSGNAGRVIDFYVEAVLTFEPTGAGLFDSLRLPRRADWLAAQADRALRIAMHGRDFWDLALSDQAEVAAHVERLLRDAAAATGQKVHPILAKVILPENRWLEKQHLEVAGESFKTKNELGVAEFDIALEIQFKTIRPLVDFVRHHRDQPRDANDFNAEIESSILGMVRKTTVAVMSQIEHSDYFARWEQWDHVGEIVAGSVRGEANYVHNRLVLAIQAELRSRFDPIVCIVRLRKVDSAVATLWRRIIALGAMTVSLNVMPRNLRSQADLIPVTIRFRSGQLEPSRVPEMVARGESHLDRSAIFDTLSGGSRQFLNDLDAAEIRSLDKGLATGYGTESGVVQPALKTRLETHVSRLMIEIYGFSVYVEDGRVDLSRAQKAMFDTSDLATVADQALADHRREQIGAELERIRRQRERNMEIVDKLYLALRDNPRKTPEDRNIYDLDETELERAKARVAEDDRRMANLIEDSTGAGRALGATAALPAGEAKPGSRPTDAAAAEDVPADDIPAGDGADGPEIEIIPPDPRRPDRL